MSNCKISFFLIFLFLFGFQSSFLNFAQAQSSLHDLMFFPEPGNLIYEGNLSLESINKTSSSASIYTETDSTEMIWQNHIKYGLDPQWELGLKLDYQLKGSSEIDKYRENDFNQSPSEVYLISKTNKKGLKDPIITNRYAILKGNLKLNILADLAISLADREDPNFTLITSSAEKESRGNASSGGHAIFLGTEFGHDKNDFQWKLAGELNFNFGKDGSIKDEIGSDPNYVDRHYSIDSYTDLSASISVQYEYDPKWVIDTELILRSHAKQTKKYKESSLVGQTETEVTQDYQSMTIRPNTYYLYKENIIFKAQLNYTHYGDHKLISTTINSSNGTSSQTTTNLKELNNLGVSIGTIVLF